MGLFIGNAFPAPSVAGRLQNQIGHITFLTRHTARWARNWLSRARWLRQHIPARRLSPSRLRGELRQLQAEMLRRTGARIAVGAGRSRVVAGTASRMGGDSLTRIIPAGQERRFLAPMPLQSLYGLAGSTLRVLRASGMVTIGELQRVPKAALQAEFGQPEGLRVWRSARGLDPLGSSGQIACEDSEALLLSGTLRAMAGR